MKPTQYFKPVSVTVSRFPLSKYHIIRVTSRTHTHTRIAHIHARTFTNQFRSITHAQFKNGYRPLNKSEVLQFVEE